MKKGAAVLEYLNFFNKVISELLPIDVKIDKEDKTLILRFHSHMITSLPSCSKIRKLSAWRRSRQLSYLMKIGKGQIKRSRQDRVWWSWEEKEDKKERKVQTHQSRVTFFTEKVTGRMTVSISKSG